MGSMMINFRHVIGAIRRTDTWLQLQVVMRTSRLRPYSASLIITIISLLRTHVRRKCLHSKNITMKHTRVILSYTIESYIG